MKLKTNKLIEEINNIGNFEDKDRGTAPVSYSDAVRRLRKKQADTEKACEEHKKEALKDTNELDSTDDSRFNHKVPKTPDLKKMHLSESLFDDWEEEEDEYDEPTYGYEEAVEYIEDQGVSCDPGNDVGEYVCDLLGEEEDGDDLYLESTLDSIIERAKEYKEELEEGFVEKSTSTGIKEAVEEDKPFTKAQVYDELKRETNNFTQKNGYAYYGFESEATMARDILEGKWGEAVVEKTEDKLVPGKIAYKVTWGNGKLEEAEEVTETPLTEAEVTNKDIIRDYFADSIVEALDNIFVKAVSATKVPQSEQEFDPLKIDNAIANLADELAKAYLGIDNLDEATRKDRGEVIRQALRRKGAENKKLTEDVDVPADTQEGRGVADMLNDLIIDEFEAITGYNNAISTITSIDAESSILKVLDDIIKEENVHVGQLQAALKEVSDAAHEIEKGNNEGDGQLGTPEVEVTEEVPEEIKSSFEDEHLG